MAKAIKDMKVGETVTSSVDVDKYRAIYYAGASGDYNPIHIDNDFGTKVGLGGAILQGLCTLAFANKTLTDWIGDPGMLKRLKCRFAKPVHMGDTVNIECKVVEVDDSRAKFEFKVTNQDNVEVLAMVSAEVAE